MRPCHTHVLAKFEANYIENVVTKAAKTNFLDVVT